MSREVKFKFPNGTITLNKNNKVYIKHNKNYVNKFNSNFNKTQVFLDKKVGSYLQKYVSYKTGTQEKSIILSTDYGSGYVKIGVPYAAYQAYSKKIKKRVGLRGTRPFERMKTDKKDTILSQTAAYSRRLNNG